MRIIDIPNRHFFQIKGDKNYYLKVPDGYINAHTTEVHTEGFYDTECKLVSDLYLAGKYDRSVTWVECWKQSLVATHV